MKVRELAFRSAGCGRRSDKRDSTLPQQRRDFRADVAFPLPTPGSF